jgi:hypothetical protein
MRVTIRTTDGGAVDIADFDPSTVLDLVEGFEAAEPGDLLRFDLDDEAMVYVQKRNVVRIDIDQ